MPPRTADEAKHPDKIGLSRRCEETAGAKECRKTKQNKKNTENAYGARQEGSSYLNQENFREKKKTSATASKPTQLISLSSQEGALRGRSFLDEFFEKRQQGREWGERFRLLTAFTS